jgi:hypothetical protein
MVIHDLDVLCPRFRPTKADAPLIVNTDAMLASPLTFKGLKAIARRHPQITQLCGNIELSQLPAGNRFDVHEPPHAYTF